MAVLNELDRFHLAMDVIDWVPSLGVQAAHAKQEMQFKLIEHTQYVCTHGLDLPEVRNWTWPGMQIDRSKASGENSPLSAENPQRAE